MQTDRVRFLGLDIHPTRFEDAVQQVLDWASQPRGESCRYVVTPNVDHAVMFQSRPDLREAYQDASLVLADGWPVVLASRLLGTPLPERVAGSDLAPALFARSKKPTLKVFLLGAAPGVAQRAAQKIEATWSGVRVVGVYSPPLGFEQDEAENQLILDHITAAQPDILLVGLGAPKQEIWVSRHRHRLQAKVALCVGATIDFPAGERKRAPVWMRKTGLEWFHRLATEPRRLAARYARDAWIFPRLVWRAWRGVPFRFE